MTRTLGNQYGRGTGPIWLSDLGCSGTESSVLQCRYSGWSVTSCGHSEDVSISCGTPDPRMLIIYYFYLTLYPVA